MDSELIDGSDKMGDPCLDQLSVTQRLQRYPEHTVGYLATVPRRREPRRAVHVDADVPLLPQKRVCRCAYDRNVTVPVGKAGIVQ